MQSKRMSAVEMATGKLLGFGVYVTAQIIILPLYFGVHIPLSQNLQIGLMFSVLAMVKSYGVRRFFNWLQWGRK